MGDEKVKQGIGNIKAIVNSLELFIIMVSMINSYVNINNFSGVCKGTSHDVT
jgi:hypothetical protein